VAEYAIHEVYRDDALLIVDKPSGMPTQRTAAGVTGLFELLQAREPYVGLHHRLDRPASGLVLFTTHPSANRVITAGFRTHAIRRTYAAVLSGSPAAQVWTHPLDGRHARSEVDVIADDRGYAAVRLSLHTGRTHQLRRHAALAGCAILGDRRYGGEFSHAWPRLALHACDLQLVHPLTGAVVSAHSPVPPDLQDLWHLAGGS